MEILKLLDRAAGVNTYEIQDYKRWSDGFYYRLKVVFADKSVCLPENMLTRLKSIMRFIGKIRKIL